MIICRKYNHQLMKFRTGICLPEQNFTPENKAAEIEFELTF